MDGWRLPHRKHRVGSDKIEYLSIYLSELREQAWGFRVDGQRVRIDLQEQRFDRMVTAVRVRLGRDGSSHHDRARRLRDLLCARGRRGGGPVELPVAVHSDRVLWNDAGI